MFDARQSIGLMTTKWISAPQPEKIRPRDYRQEEIIQEKDDVVSERIRPGGVPAESRNKKIPPSH
jgi:hypothetical protein